MWLLLSIWLAVGIGVAWAVSQSRPSAGLPLAYFIQLSLIHVPGAVLYLDSDDTDSLAAAATKVGFEQTVIGVVAFLGGVVLARYVLDRHAAQHAGQRPRNPGPDKLVFVDSLARYYLWTGGAVYFAGGKLIGSIPSATALVSTLQSLILVGACLRIWVACKLRDQFKFWSTMALLPLLPLTTVVTSGFLGYGTAYAVVIATFLFARSNRKALYVLFAPVVFFAGLSLFVNYAAARNDIRQLVWFERVSLEDRLQRIAEVFQNFDWLDLSNPLHREAIDERLNQNSLVGVAVERLELGKRIMRTALQLAR